MNILSQPRPPAAASPFHHYVVHPPPSTGVGKFMEEKGTASLHPLPPLFQGWVASAYILSCAPLLVMGERATQWRGGIAKGMLPAAADIKYGL